MTVLKNCLEFIILNNLLSVNVLTYFCARGSRMDWIKSIHDNKYQWNLNAFTQIGIWHLFGLFLLWKLVATGVFPSFHLWEQLIEISKQVIFAFCTKPLTTENSIQLLSLRALSGFAVYLSFAKVRYFKSEYSRVGSRDSGPVRHRDQTNNSIRLPTMKYWLKHL